jgi:hypothetical protein
MFFHSENTKTTNKEITFVEQNEQIAIENNHKSVKKE